VKRRWQAFVRFTGEREAGWSLAVMRIAVGLVAFFGMLENVTYGVVELVWVEVDAGGVFDVGGNWLVRLLGGATPGVVWALVVGSLIGSAAVAIGLGGRLATFATIQVYQAVSTLNSSAGGGYDALLTNAMWLLVIGNASATLSLDSRLKHGKWNADVTVPAIARRLAIFQILIVYLTTGLHKLSPVWTPVGGYSALYWIFQEPTWRRFDMRWTAHVYPLTQLATAVTWHWETGAGLMFLFYWYRATPERKGWLRRQANRFDLRIPFLGIGLMLHLGILILIAVGPFSYASLAYYFAFLTPEETRRIWQRIRARIGPAPSVLRRDAA
jgi:hypothetical protein